MSQLEHKREALVFTSGFLMFLGSY